MRSPIQKWEEMHTRFSKEDIQMANRHTKRCPTSLIIRDTEVKTTVRGHLTSVRMAKIKTSRNNERWGCGEKGILVRSWWESKPQRPLEDNMEVPQKENDCSDPGSDSWSRNFNTGYEPKEYKNTNLKDIHAHTYVYCSSMYKSQHMEAAQVSANRWMDKVVWCTQTTEYYAAIKKNEILPFAMTWMDLESIRLSQIRQLEKDIPYDFTSYVELNKRKKWAKGKKRQARNRLITVENRGLLEGRSVGQWAK